ncbi:hypothetical protein CLOL250_00478 [Clostridium sp. L2-50]|nr:hypothetical protein CLOL250_00478 [Clostridium sp. L2-50]
MNQDYEISVAGDLFVLIDTWWNVNKALIGQTASEFMVLIDTWWNVNVNLKLTCQVENLF